MFASIGSMTRGLPSRRDIVISCWASDKGEDAGHLQICGNVSYSSLGLLHSNLNDSLKHNALHQSIRKRNEQAIVAQRFSDKHESLDCQIIRFVTNQVQARYDSTQYSTHQQRELLQLQYIYYYSPASHLVLPDRLYHCAPNSVAHISDPFPYLALHSSLHTELVLS